jgi:hypothetical protein
VLARQTRQEVVVMVEVVILEVVKIRGLRLSNWLN